MIYKGGLYPFWYIYGNRVFIKAVFIPKSSALIFALRSMVFLIMGNYFHKKATGDFQLHYKNQEKGFLRQGNFK
jgi:hypothetical protein